MWSTARPGSRSRRGCAYSGCRLRSRRSNTAAGGSPRSPPVAAADCPECCEIARGAQDDPFGGRCVGTGAPGHPGGDRHAVRDLRSGRPGVQPVLLPGHRRWPSGRRGDGRGAEGMFAETTRSRGLPPCSTCAHRMAVSLGGAGALEHNTREDANRAIATALRQHASDRKAREGAGKQQGRDVGLACDSDRRGEQCPRTSADAPSATISPSSGPVARQLLSLSYACMRAARQGTTPPYCEWMAIATMRGRR